MKIRSKTLVIAVALVLAAIPGGAQIAASYDFEGGSLADTSGNGNDAVPVGAPVVDAGIEGDGLLLDAASGFIVPDDASLHTETPAVSLWVRVESWTAGTLVIKRIDGDGYQLSTTADGLVVFRVQDGVDEALVTSPYPIMPNVWTSIFARYNGSDVELYLHGELAASTIMPGLAPANTSPVKLAEGFAGVFDSVQLGRGLDGADYACGVASKVWNPDTATCLHTLVDVAAELGVQDTINRTFGATLVDIDRDGWLDLYWVNGNGNPEIDPLPPSGTCPDISDVPFVPGSANALFMNRGDGTFTADRAPQMGLADEWNAMRHVWADYDRDGLLDVVSHNFIYSPLYRQLPTGGAAMLFEDVNLTTGPGLCLTRGTGASWVDFNNDGYLDLHAVEYAPSQLAVDHVVKLYLNDTAGGFIDVTDETGLAGDNPMGQVFGDYDNDGDQDLFATNSHEAPTRLYHNEGLNGNGVPVFVDVAEEAGVAVIGEPNRGIGAAFGDYDNDGRLDLLFSREADSRLFRNLGPGRDGVWRFRDVTNRAGLDMAGFMYWGGGFADLDNDGDLDIVMTNRINGPSAVFINNGDRSWQSVAGLLGMEMEEHMSMGFVAGDVDNDGDLDVAITTHAAAGEEGPPNFFYRNESRGNNWIQLRLTGTVSNPEAVGARITIRAALQPGAPETRQIREIVAGTGFGEGKRIVDTGNEKDSIPIRIPSDRRSEARLGGGCCRGLR